MAEVVEVVQDRSGAAAVEVSRFLFEFLLALLRASLESELLEFSALTQLFLNLKK